MTLDFTKLTKSAKALLVAAVVAAGGMQIDTVKDKVTPYLANHPKLTSAFGAFVFVVGLLHNPVVYNAVAGVLDIHQTSPTEAEVTIKPTEKPNV